MKLNFAIGKAIAAIIISSLIHNAGNAQVNQFAALTSISSNFTATLSASVGKTAISINWPASFSTNDFTIERSFDRNEFKTVCYVFGVENTEAVDLLTHYNDRSAELNGKTRAYYRIKQADKSGAITYSELVSVALN